MSIKLRDLIRNVRACKTASEERAVIAKECALIRTAFKDEDTSYRDRNVAKLLFIHMLGYPSHFGQMECLKLIASSKFMEKRVGYLGLSLLVDETTEVLMLVTNSLSSDLNHQSPYIVGLALAALGNVSSKEMLRDLSSQVHKLLGNSNPYIRKKAALCAARMFHRVPELVEDFIDRIISLLAERNHAVMLTTITLLTDVVTTHKEFVGKVRKSLPGIIKILKDLILSGFSPEHDVSGITDPFLQVKTIRLLGFLGENHAAASDEMNDILAQVTTNTDSARNVGNSILYECVRAIMKIDAEDNLRVLAINILGRFLQNKDNNIRYVALQTLGSVVAIDTRAVHKHRQTIVDCLRDPDSSIRVRALDLIYALLSKSNVEALTTELLNYLVIASSEQKEDVCSRLTPLIEKFAPSKSWHIDTLITMLSIAGSEAPQTAWQTLIVLIGQPASQDYRPVAISKLYDALLEDSRQSGLVKAALWSLGEFAPLIVDGGHTDGKIVSEDDVIDLLERTRKLHNATVETKGMILNAYLKLSTRFSSGSLERLRELVGTFKSSMTLELQARSCEYMNLLSEEYQQPLKDEWLTPMPVPTDEQLAARRGKLLNEDDEDGEEADLIEEENMLDLGDAEPQSNRVSSGQAKNAGNLLDLDDIFGGAPQPSNAPAATTTNTAAAADSLADIFGSGPAAQPAAAPQPNPSNDILGMFGESSGAAPTGAPPQTGGVDDLLVGMGLGAPAAAATTYPPLEVLNKDGLLVKFDFADGQSPGEVIVNATYSNSNDDPVTSFLFEAAVPKFLSLKLETPSGSEIDPYGTVTQRIVLVNSKKGVKKIVMKVKVSYTLAGSRKTEQLTVNGFPQGL